MYLISDCNGFVLGDNVETIDNIPPWIGNCAAPIDFLQEPVSLGWFRASTNLILLQQNGGMNDFIL